jgi:hypothetical protein
MFDCLKEQNNRGTLDKQKRMRKYKMLVDVLEMRTRKMRRRQAEKHDEMKQHSLPPQVQKSPSPPRGRPLRPFSNIGTMKLQFFSFLSLPSFKRLLLAQGVARQPSRHHYSVQRDYYSYTRNPLAPPLTTTSHHARPIFEVGLYLPADKQQLAVLNKAEVLEVALRQPVFTAPPVPPCIGMNVLGGQICVMKCSVRLQIWTK